MASRWSAYTSEAALREQPDRTVVGDATDPAVAKALINRIVVEVGPPAVPVNTLSVHDG